MKNKKIPHCRNSSKSKSKIVLIEVKLPPLSHKCMTAHLPVLAQALQ